MVEVALAKSIAVITLKFVYEMDRHTQEVFHVLSSTDKIVDDFVPHAYREERARCASFTYSLGVYSVPTD